MGGRSPLPALAFTLSLLLALARCSDDRHPVGDPCTAGPQCQTGLCLDRGAAGAVCVARCTSDDDCGATAVCGRFDFRGRDDSGIPSGEESDVVHVCRPPLQASCTAGCATGERCTVGEQAVCVPRCRDRLDCGGRDCIADCAGSYCAPACDSFRDCPRFFVCDTSFLGTDGHSRCLPAATDASDASMASDAVCADAP